MTAPLPLVEQLRQAIRATGRSLTQLGKAAGIDSGRLSRFLRGERDLSLSAAGKLCTVLGLCLARADQDGSATPSRSPNGIASGSRSSSDWVAWRRRKARQLAEAVSALGRDAKSEDFSARTHAVFDGLRETSTELMDAPEEGNTRAALRDVRDTFLDGGWAKYRSAKVRRGVAAVLMTLAEADEVTPGDVEATYARLRSLGLDPVACSLPDLDRAMEAG